jgi:hypothetical protein
MASLIIDTFKDDKPEATFKIPLAVLTIAAKLIPKRAFQAMEDKGINIEEVIKAAKSGEISGQILEIVDHEEKERVAISVA